MDVSGHLQGSATWLPGKEPPSPPPTVWTDPGCYVWRRYMCKRYRTDLCKSVWSNNQNFKDCHSDWRHPCPVSTAKFHEYHLSLWIFPSLFNNTLSGGDVIQPWMTHSVRRDWGRINVGVTLQSTGLTFAWRCWGKEFYSQSEYSVQMPDFKLQWHTHTFNNTLTLNSNCYSFWHFIE
jgi:hypothetical protein